MLTESPEPRHVSEDMVQAEDPSKCGNGLNKRYDDGLSCVASDLDSSHGSGQNGRTRWRIGAEPGRRRKWDHVYCQLDVWQPENLELTAKDFNNVLISPARNLRRCSERLSVLLSAVHQQRPVQDRRASSSRQQPATGQSHLRHRRSPGRVEERSGRTHQS
jgi:hypothetical protein